VLSILSSNAILSTFFSDFSNSCSSVILRDQVFQSPRVEVKVVYPKYKATSFLFILEYLFLYVHCILNLLTVCTTAQYIFW
jgi:hypothetical protein